MVPSEYRAVSAQSTLPQFLSINQFQQLDFLSPKMPANDLRRKMLLDQLAEKARIQLDASLPELRSAADIGLHSLDADDEIQKIAELDAQSDDLLDLLRGIGWLGDQARSGQDLHQDERQRVLDAVCQRLYDAIPASKGTADLKLKSLWMGQSRALQELEASLGKEGLDYYALLLRLAE